MFCSVERKSQKQKVVKKHPAAQQKRIQQSMHGHSKPDGRWKKKLLFIFVTWNPWFRMVILAQEFRHCTKKRRNACHDVHAFAILVSTFHHGKHPSAVDQNIFGQYTESSAFERPLTSGVAYALKVLHSDRMHFEKQHGWTIKKMEAENEALIQDCIPENLDPAPIQDEYAPVIFAQETISHIVSIDMMSGKEDHENILRARASGKGVLTSPFKLLKSNHLGVVLTFAVYNSNLPPDATLDQRMEATVGYLGASIDVPSLVDKLLHQLASKETIVVNVYDTTNASAPITMYGTDVIDTRYVNMRCTAGSSIGLNFLGQHSIHPWG
ncbi:Histidine kinase 2 [Trifolium repens]|nr:Histidine kinase 2 [Trifolium repens]